MNTSTETIADTKTASDEEKRKLYNQQMKVYRSKPENKPKLQRIDRDYKRRRYANDPEYRQKQNNANKQRYYDRKLLKMYHDLWD